MPQIDPAAVEVQRLRERLGESLESARTVRSHLLCGGSVTQAVAELDAVIGKVGG